MHDTVAPAGTVMMCRGRAEHESCVLVWSWCAVECYALQDCKRSALLCDSRRCWFVARPERQTLFSCLVACSCGHVPCIKTRGLGTCHSRYRQWVLVSATTMTTVTHKVALERLSEVECLETQLPCVLPIGDCLSWELPNGETKVPSDSR
jgi:hypothetical protein